jgi:hypothetical protein
LEKFINQKYPCQTDQSVVDEERHNPCPRDLVLSANSNSGEWGNDVEIQMKLKDSYICPISSTALHPMYRWCFEREKLWRHLDKESQHQGARLKIGKFKFGVFVRPQLDQIQQIS